MRAEAGEELKKKIDEAAVVSFDLYDTLIFRKQGEPQKVFRLMGCLVQRPDWPRVRARMQRRAYRDVKNTYGYPHPSLHEIYQHQCAKRAADRQKMHQNAKRAADRQKTHQCTKRAADRLRRIYETIERRLEQNEAFPNRAMQEIYRYAKNAGRRVVVTTDMYLEENDIRKILTACGYQDVEAIYLSSEVKKTKYDGSMYPYLIEKERVRPGRILHIGNDEHADVTMAGRFGIRTFYYIDGDRDFADSLYYASHSEMPRLSASRTEVQKAGIDHPDRSVMSVSKTVLSSQNAFWYLMGYQIGGPFYMGLCSWIKEKAGGRKLYCLSRDGYNLTRVMKKFGMDHCIYLYASRRALLLPAIDRLGEKELALLPPYSCGQTVGEVLDYLNLEGITDADLIRQGFSADTDVIRTKGDIARIKKVYVEKESEILKQCAKERMNLERYFRSEGLFGREALFFDSGWNGTSQYLLERIYRLLGAETDIKFLYAGLKNSSKSAEYLGGSHYEAFMNERLRPQKLNAVLDGAAVLELFFSEDAPALQRYGDAGLEFEQCRQNGYLAWINQGLEDYISHNSFLIKDRWMAGLQRYALVGIEELLTMPSVRQAEQIGNIENVDSISAGSYMKKYIARIPVRSLWKNPFLDIYWERGVYRHPKNSLAAKLFVFTRQRIAQWKGRHK